MVAELVWEREPHVRRGIFVAAFTGWFDAATAATGALDALVEHHGAEPLVRIEGDELFDLQQQRPLVNAAPDRDTHVEWPENVVRLVAPPDAGHDLLVLSGIEPQFQWRRFCELMLDVVHTTGCEMVVTLGSSPATVPHTRLPSVFGSSTNEELARRLGLSRPQYQGITGVVGAFHDLLDRVALPAIAMRVGIPHYAASMHDPQAAMALLRHLEHVTGVPTGHATLDEAVTGWREHLDAAVADDEGTRAYVHRLEAAYDAELEEQLDAADGLAEQLQRFLDDQRDDTP